MGYCRVSTAAQDLDMQRAAVAEAALSRGLVLSNVFEDDAVSGDAATRNGLNAALGAVCGGGTLIVRELSRLGRDNVDVLETGRAIIDAGIRLISVAEGIDTADSSGRDRLERELGFRAMFVEEEKRVITERLYAGRMRAKAKGQRYASVAPYGKRLAADGRTLEDDTAEQRAISRIRELADDGLSVRAIGATLFAEGILPRSGGNWSTSAISYIINGNRPKTYSKKTSRAVRSAAFWNRIAATNWPSDPVTATVRTI